MDTSGTGLADVNPFRYRGYYYDSETGYYYLNSRYYDPETGRFLNADDPAYIGDSGIGGNLYAYCRNNAVNMEDPDGNFALSSTAAAFIADSIISVFVIFLVYKLKEAKNNKRMNKMFFIADCMGAIAKCYLDSYKKLSKLRTLIKVIISAWNSYNSQTSFFKRVINFIITYLTLTIVDKLWEKLPNPALYVSKKGWLRVSMCGGKYATQLNLAVAFTSLQETFAAIIRRIR